MAKSPSIRYQVPNFATIGFVRDNGHVQQPIEARGTAMSFDISKSFFPSFFLLLSFPSPPSASSKMWSSTLSISTLSLLLSAFHLVQACPGIDHAQGLSPRSNRVATQPSGGTSLLKPLTWGSLNVIATTDIHGWYQGHLKSSDPEPNYS